MLRTQLSLDQFTDLLEDAQCNELWDNRVGFTEEEQHGFTEDMYLDLYRHLSKDENHEAVCLEDVAKNYISTTYDCAAVAFYDDLRELVHASGDTFQEKATKRKELILAALKNDGRLIEAYDDRVLIHAKNTEAKPPITKKESIFMDYDYFMSTHGDDAVVKRFSEEGIKALLQKIEVPLHWRDYFTQSVEAKNYEEAYIELNLHVEHNNCVADMLDADIKQAVMDAIGEAQIHDYEYLNNGHILLINC